MICYSDPSPFNTQFLLDDSICQWEALAKKASTSVTSVSPSDWSCSQVNRIKQSLRDSPERTARVLRQECLRWTKWGAELGPLLNSVRRHGIFALKEDIQTHQQNDKAVQM